MNGKIVYWKMSNGHEHSFFTEEEDWTLATNVAGGYEINGTPVKTQGEYIDYICETENTDVEDEQIFDWSDDGIRKALEYSAISIDDDEYEIEDMEYYAEKEGVIFI